MKKTFYISILFITLTSCGILTSDKKAVCNCCDKTYTSIDSAQNCVLGTPDTTTTAEDRLLLFAFVNKDVEANQNLGWNIIKDQEIIDAAKKKYLLIILDVNKIKIPNGQNAPEFLEIINSHKDNMFFVMTNQALYPIGNWTIDEKKDQILGALHVGAGP